MDTAGLIFIAVVSTVVIVAARRVGRKRERAAAESGGSGSGSGGGDGDGADQPIALVSQEQALLRLRCLRLMSVRGVLEQMIDAVTADNPARSTVVAAVSQQWAEANDPELAKLCSARERSALAAKVGGWDRQQLVDASWSVESGAVLAWALGVKAELPAYDREADSKEVFGHLDEATPRLRSAAEIERGRDTAELWHWRARTTQLERSGKKVPLPPGYTLAKIVAQTAELSQKKGLFQAQGGDFPAFGKPYRDLGEEEQALAMSIARERHRAFNWLCGYEADWDEVPTGT